MTDAEEALLEQAKREAAAFLDRHFGELEEQAGLAPVTDRERQACVLAVAAYIVEQRIRGVIPVYRFPDATDEIGKYEV